MSSKIGSIYLHQWNGPSPPVVKSQVDLIYRPGQSIAAAKILPNQSSEGQFETTTFVAAVDAHTTADSFRSLIGTIVALIYRGVSYGNVLVRDVQISDVSTIIMANGLQHGGAFAYSPAGRITARWNVVRLS